MDLGVDCGICTC